MGAEEIGTLELPDVVGATAASAVEIDDEWVLAVFAIAGRFREAVGHGLVSGVRVSAGLEEGGDGGSLPFEGLDDGQPAGRIRGTRIDGGSLRREELIMPVDLVKDQHANEQS